MKRLRESHLFIFEFQDEPEIEVTERETWMLELPAENNKNFGLGPRKFRTKAPTTGGDRSGWTDTPQDRERKEKVNERHYFKIIEIYFHL